MTHHLSHPDDRSITASSYYTTQEKVDQYEAVISVFEELFKELKELGKKKPETTLSSAKVKIINRVLTDVRVALQGQPDHKYLDLLGDETLPQYSDATLILAQYDGALKAFRERSYVWTGVKHAWLFKPKKG